MHKLRISFRTLLALFLTSTHLIFIHSAALAASTEPLPETLPQALTLAEVIQRTLQKNKTLQGAQYSVAGQQVNLASATSELDIKFHPQALLGTDQDGEQLGAGILVSKKFTSGPTASIAPRYGKLQDEYTGSVALALSIPLLRGRGDEIGMDSIESNRFQLEILKLQNKILQEDLVIQAISLVYNIINAHEHVIIYKNSIDKMQDNLLFVQAKEQIGLASPMDVYRIVISLKGYEDRLVQVNNTLAQQKDRLKVLISYPFENDIQVNAPQVSDDIDINMEESISIALNKRLDIKIHDLEIEEARRRIKISEHNIMPQLKIVVDYDNTSVDFFGNSILEGEERWGVRLEGDTDVSRTNEKAQLIKDNLEMQRKKLNLQEKIESIKAGIKNQIVSLEKAKLRYSIRQQLKIQAEGKLALANLKFRFGMSDNFEVIQSENEVQEALLNIISVRSEYIIGTYRLRQQLGTLLE